MELKDLLRKMKQELKQAQGKASGPAANNAGASDALLKKQREEHERAMQELQAEIEGTSINFGSTLSRHSCNPRRF